MKTLRVLEITLDVALLGILLGVSYAFHVERERLQAALAAAERDRDIATQMVGLTIADVVDCERYAEALRVAQEHAVLQWPSTGEPGLTTMEVFQLDETTSTWAVPPTDEFWTDDQGRVHKTIPPVSFPIRVRITP